MALLHDANGNVGEAHLSILAETNQAFVDIVELE